MTTTTNDLFHRIPPAAFQTYARYKKAEQLVATLIDNHVPAEAIPDLTPDRRQQLENIAGIRIASDITWGIAALILTQRDPHAHPAPRKTRTPKPATVADIHKALTNAAQAHGRQPKLF